MNLAGSPNSATDRSKGWRRFPNLSYSPRAFHPPFTCHLFSFAPFSRTLLCLPSIRHDSGSSNYNQCILGVEFKAAFRTDISSQPAKVVAAIATVARRELMAPHQEPSHEDAEKGTAAQ